MINRQKRKIVMSKQRTSFSPEFKMQVVLESFNANIPTAKLAEKYGTSVKNIMNWKQQFFKNAHLSFDATTSTNGLESLKKENEKLEKRLMELQREKDEAVKKLQNLDISIKKQLVDTDSSLSIVQQCKIIGLNRPSLYYAPRPSKKNDEAIMERIGEIFQTNQASYGYRTMHQLLIKEGYKIGVNKVHKLIKLLEEEKGIKPSSKKVDATKHESLQHSHILHDLALAKPFT